MQYPTLNVISQSRDMLRDFRGYNHNLVISDGEWFDMQNMTSDHYPVLSSRGKRGIIRKFGKPNGMFAKNKLCWVDGTQFYYNGALVPELTLVDTQKQFVGIGAYILIWPDRKYYKITDGTSGTLGAEFHTAGTVTYELTKITAESYDDYIVSSTAPSNPSDKQIWLDTSGETHVLKQYSATTEIWNEIPTTYIKISNTGIGVNFNQYDCVTISGSEDDRFNTDFIIWAKSDDYIIVIGLLDQVLTQTTSIKVERRIPDMAFLCESENRVWGCSKDGHEIYASKLGDPFNWNYFWNTENSSFAYNVGSDGLFTGACSHLGYVLFFKEDCIHKVYGSSPSNYQITDYAVRGVQNGSEKSLVTVNETLFYKSRNGICAYDGSLPVDISIAFGAKKYSNAVAGTVGDKYYVSMCDEEDKYHLFVYDTAKQMWHREDHTHVVDFSRVGGELYYVDADDLYLKSVLGTTDLYAAPSDPAKLEKDMDWFVESGDIGLSDPDYKYISRIRIRMDLDLGAMVQIAVKYDCNGWDTVYATTGFCKRSITVPILLKRCDHMRLRISGTGGCKIYSISKVTERGGDTP